MGIRFDHVTVLCDSSCRACAGRCTAITAASLDNGQLRVLIPPGWTQDGDQLLGPHCAEERALLKVMRATVPDPSQDPPVLKKDRDHRLEAMKEAIRADLEDRRAEFPELREYVRQLILKDENIPNFLGHIGDAGIRTEVRVLGDYVEISFGSAGEGGSGMSLTLRHRDLELVDPPAFVDPKIVGWVQNCLRTMEADEVCVEGPVTQ